MAGVRKTSSEEAQAKEGTEGDGSPQKKRRRKDSAADIGKIPSEEVVKAGEGMKGDSWDAELEYLQAKLNEKRSLENKLDQVRREIKGLIHQLASQP